MTDLTLLDTRWILLCAFLVMTMQIGFCMLEAGMVRQKNNINVAFKNLMDFIVAGLVYWVVGFGIMFGIGDANGFFGTSMFLKSHDDGAVAFFLFQMMFCSAAATIVGGAVAERTRLSGYLIISALVAAVMYPLMGHWAWGGTLDNGPSGWLAQRGFIDYAGSTVVHGTGGWLALAAVLIVGPRIGRFDKSAKAPKGSNYPVATVGVLMLWFGWFGFNGGSGLKFDEQVSIVLVNTSLAAAAGGFSLLSLAWIKEKKPDIALSLNGTIAGLVGVSAGAHMYETTDAILVGVVCAATCGIATRLLQQLEVDDVISAWPAHAIAGATGTLMVALVGDMSFFAEGTARPEQLVIQATGVATVAAWAFGFGYLLLFMINKIFPLRVSEEDEIMGLNVAEHDAKSEFGELVDEVHRMNSTYDNEDELQVNTSPSDAELAIENRTRVYDRVRRQVEAREQAKKGI